MMIEMGLARGQQRNENIFLILKIIKAICKASIQ